MVTKVVSLLLLAIVFASIVDQTRCDLVKGVLLGSLIANNQKNDRVIVIPLHGRVKHRQPSTTTTTSTTTSAPETTTTTEPTTTTTEPTTTTTEPTTTTSEPTTTTTEPPTTTTTSTPPSPTTSTKEYDDEDHHHIYVPVMPWTKKRRSG